MSSRATWRKLQNFPDTTDVRIRYVTAGCSDTVATDRAESRCETHARYQNAKCRCRVRYDNQEKEQQGNLRCSVIGSRPQVFRVPSKILFSMQVQCRRELPSWEGLCGHRECERLPIKDAVARIADIPDRDAKPIEAGVLDVDLDRNCQFKRTTAR